MHDTRHNQHQLIKSDSPSIHMTKSVIKFKARKLNTEIQQLTIPLFRFHKQPNIFSFDHMALLIVTKFWKPTS